MNQEHPPPGESIELTAISNREVGKFYGTYVPGDGTHFALDPLPGKKFVQQLPMYRFQGSENQISNINDLERMS